MKSVEEVIWFGQPRWGPLSGVIVPLGSSKNYVDKIWVFSDHLPTSSGCKRPFFLLIIVYHVTYGGHFADHLLPLLVYVVFGWPLKRMVLEFFSNILYQCNQEFRKDVLYAKNFSLWHKIWKEIKWNIYNEKCSHYLTQSTQSSFINLRPKISILPRQQILKKRLENEANTLVFTKLALKYFPVNC